MQNTTTFHNQYSLQRLFPEAANMWSVDQVQKLVAGHHKFTMMNGDTFNVYSCEIGGTSLKHDFRVEALLVQRADTPKGKLTVIRIEDIAKVESRKVEMTEERMAEIRARRAERMRNR